MSNHFATIRTTTGKKIDFIAYEKNGKTFLSIHGNDRKDVEILVLDEDSMKHCYKAIDAVLCGDITPDNGAIYWPSKPS